MTDTINEARALLIAHDEGYRVHVGCGGEVDARTMLCAKCDEAIGVGQFAHPDKLSAAATGYIRALVAGLEAARAELAAARAALAEIARPKRGGIEIGDTDEDHIAYWRGATERERRTARDALVRLDTYLASQPGTTLRPACEVCGIEQDSVVCHCEYDAESPETRARLDAACAPFGGDRQPVRVSLDDLFGPTCLPETYVPCVDAVYTCAPTTTLL